MPHYRAAWILPIASPPISDGWVAIEHGRIAALGRRREGAAGPPQPEDVAIDLGSVAILPGLVNAHTHLELSWLRGRVAPAHEFVDWIRDQLRRRLAPPDRDTIACAIAGAIDEARQAGTALVGDISNTLASAAPLAAGRLWAVVFKELIRFRPDDPARLVAEAREELAALPRPTHLRVSLAAHAPYSVAPILFRAIRQAIDQDPCSPCSVHLGESQAEIEFLRRGGGPWRALLEELGSWDPGWVVPGCGPVEYLADAGFLDERVLAVHGVRLTPPELGRLASLGATLVTCPRSNLHTGAGVPPVAAFYASGVRVAVGTDSLASVSDLNLFSELAELRRLAPAVPAGTLLESATRQGARALGFDADFGTIEPGKRAALIAVEIPAGAEDVEECLVSGIRPEQVHWLDDETSNSRYQGLPVDVLR